MMSALTGADPAVKATITAARHETTCFKVLIAHLC
jgi:hypothetical protein